ncbi:MAG: hypothetical protein CSA21_00655 [Deltaproteobacteria bacterium]|nr:MAG: hypothetical protein CSA21_00655 [Deltaproteobacteria bacterium]
MKSSTFSKPCRPWDDASAGVNLPENAARLSEAFWFSVTLLLFLVMGPFSIVAVLIGLCSLATKEQRMQMIEPASL